MIDLQKGTSINVKHQGLNCVYKIKATKTQSNSN